MKSFLFFICIFLIFYSCSDGSNDTEKKGTKYDKVKISNMLPNGDLEVFESKLEISVDTDINAYCHYSSVSNLAYDEMIAFTTTGELSHKSNLNVIADKEYTIYVKCVRIEDKTVETEASYKFKTAAKAITEEKFRVNINFGTEASDVLLDYTNDRGDLFGDRDVEINENSYKFGWSISNTLPRLRSKHSDIRYDSMNHMQHKDYPQDISWEIEVPNGEYIVRLIAGDSEYYANMHFHILIEGSDFIDEAPSASNHFADITKQITVTDGKLSITNGTKATANRIAFIEIEKGSEFSTDIAPLNVSDLNISSASQKIYLNWVNPYFNYDGAIVLASNSSLENLVLEDGKEYILEETVENGKVIMLGKENSASDIGLTDGNTYYYKVFTRNSSFIYSSGVSISKELKPLTQEELEKVVVDHFSELTPESSKDDIVDSFNEFAKLFFSAENAPVVYEKFGNDLIIKNDSIWKYISEKSVAFFYQTNLPSIASVEYGLSESNLDKSVSSDERNFYNHLLHVNNLSADTNYYYRFKSVDQRGNIVYSDIESFKTKAVDSSIVRIPEDFPDGPPFNLDQDNTKYLVTENIDANNTAISITGDGVELDLGGNSISFSNTVYDGASNANSNETSNIGVRIFNANDVKVINGKIIEGNSGNNGNASYGGVNDIYFNGTNLELAAIYMEYHSVQQYAVYLNYPNGKIDIHHNSFLDRGKDITNRHGAGGGRAIYFRDRAENLAKINDYHLNYNLIKRTRQCGLGRANEITNNEIYVDSWAANSFAIQPHSAPDVRAGLIADNKLFLTGYYAIAMGWAHLDLEVENNFVHLEAVNTSDNRAWEGWGEQNVINGFRITNYGDGLQVRDNLHYINNIFVGHARNGGSLRGIEFYAGKFITNTVLENSYFELYSLDELSLEVTPVVAQGTLSTQDEHKPVVYKNLILKSNMANIRFGDSYGKGNNHNLYDCTFEKIGDHPNYHTIVFDGAYSNYNHSIIDPIFVNGASYEDVRWERTGAKSSFTLKWSLELTGQEGDEINIYNKDNELEFSGTLDDSGQSKIPLSQALIAPLNWDGTSGAGVNQKDEHQKIVKTPHKVVVKRNNTEILNQTIEMTEKKTITIP